MNVPRGLKNNNPLNLRPSGDLWIGLSPEQTDPGYLQFQTSFHGIRAAAKNLLTYFRVRKLQTPAAIINRWAPESDNNPTSAYAATVAKALGAEPADRIDLENRDVMLRMIKVMIGVECGQQPFSDAELTIAIKSAYDSHTAALDASSAPPSSDIEAMPVPLPRISPPPSPAAPPSAKTIPPLVSQPTPIPTRKVVVGGAAGAVAFVIMILWNKYLPGAPIPAEYATEIAGLVILAVTLVTQYFVKNRATDIPPGPTQPEEKPEP